ncbi:hypothetical protein MHYP_G00046360 [Metynnis hypsauchen]
MSGKRKPAQKQPGTETTVEDTAGKPPQDPSPPQKLKCFQDILDIVDGLSDEEWTPLTSDAQRSKAEFASLCTNIAISAVKNFLPTLIHTLGLEAALTAEEQLRKKTQSESRSPSDHSTRRSTKLQSDDGDHRLSKQVDVESSTDKVIHSIVDSFKKEVPLDKSGSSEDREASPSSDQGNDTVVTILNHHELSSSHSAPHIKDSQANVLTAKSERFLIKASQVVSDLLVKSDHCSPSTSTVSLNDVHDAAVNIAAAVVEALNQRVESGVIDSQSDSDVIIRSLDASMHTEGAELKSVTYPRYMIDLDSCTHDVIGKIVELYYSEFLLPKLSSSTLRQINDSVSLRSIFSREDGIHEDYRVYKICSCCSQTSVNMKTIESPEFVNEDDQVVSDIMLKRTAPKTAWNEPRQGSLTFNQVTETPQACRSTSDSVMETCVRNLLRDPIQIPLAVDYPFVEGSGKSLLLHVLSHNTELPSLISSDRDMQGTSFEGQSRNADKSSGFRCASTSAVSHFTKALADLVMKSLPSAVAVSDTKEDPLNLVKPETLDMERIHGIPGTDSISPPPPSSRIANDVMRQTLENFVITSQEGPTSYSSSHTLNDNPALNPDPVVLKKRPHGFWFHIFKKVNKVSPAGLLSADHPLNSSPGNHQEASQGESEDLMTPFKKARKRLSRIFSSIRKAVPTPLSCMTRPC